MVFVKEYISEEDKKKYGHTSTWTIDRERKVFLINSGLDRERGMECALYRYQDGELLFKTRAVEHSIKKVPDSNDPADGFIQRYVISNLFIPQSHLSDQNKILVMVREALIESCSGLPNQKFTNIEVEVIFPNHKF